MTQNNQQDEESRVVRPKRLTTNALIECANWLSYCVSIGWPKSDLDFLESLWWKHHDRLGNLKRAGEQP